MSQSSLNITQGVNGKDVASSELIKLLEGMEAVSGECFFGYPLIATPDGKYSIDATLVSPEKGIILFDLVEGVDVGDYESRQDDLINKIEARLKLHKELVSRRRLKVPLEVITFVPALMSTPETSSDDYPIANVDSLPEVLGNIVWESPEDDLYRLSLSAIETLSSIRKSRSKREVEKPDSRGARLKNLENSIATLDHRQNKAVIETVEGVQRIRGLAGSGKTIVLALKAAYLHTQYPSWRIAVTFHTRSLKAQIKRLINNFCIEQGGEEPDWQKVRVLNAWGAPGGSEREGLYHEFCKSTDQEFYDFGSAKARFGGASKAFDGACTEALANNKTNRAENYDAILVDEAQDFAPSFMRLCYQMLREPKRLVYAYDELQNLSGGSMPPPEEVFGKDEQGRPLVTLEGDRRRDVMLQKCYRNSRPILVTAHALGFGMNRPAPKDSDTGLVQMFDQPELLEEIGYEVESGKLKKGDHVVLKRTADTSPLFLEDHSPIDDLVQFKCFRDEEEQNDWVAEQISTNLEEDELQHDDIIVINPDPVSARNKVGPIRRRLFDREIQTHLAGVDTMADVFFKSEVPSVTFTGIYRAKGNEAGMVYIINAQDCESGVGLATLRNRLFTAITRSKAWVRVVGYGQGMQNLASEFESLKSQDFKLDFTYPDDKALGNLRVVHQDLSEHEKRRIERAHDFVPWADGILKDLETGRMRWEHLDQKLSDLLQMYKKMRDEQ